ncbi:hypothetical protein L1987_79673 [Smallanthus sonchifolius]|uniref:Uncharacterized protein n=1 Tax=Smallanthus sonchifolius TaxID=185202 RepID=A0ACB8YM15_9ASTR|nr:hypothetical protein L1987_79673 [Smallanthus sonchifolius]
MDSGNSGSLQSSSGGDGGGGGGDVNPSAHFNRIPIVQPRSNFFDPSSFSQPLNPNPTPMYNLDSLWSGNQNSNPIYDLESQQPQDPYLNPNRVDEKLGVTMKNPKKRTRASRRAPTTVLTTDTTNFRQMVQEFTGIPAAPFSASPSSSPFARRLDLYTGIAPVLPLRPSAQKIQVQQPSYTTTTSSFQFQLHPSETHGLTKQPLNLSNLQNQMFPFHSLSQSTLPQQINLTERENHPSEHPDAFLSSSSTSLKRWRGQDENMMNFEGRNGNSQNVVVSLRNDDDGDDQLPGNEDSWICPSD